MIYKTLIYIKTLIIKYCTFYIIHSIFKLIVQISLIKTLDLFVISKNGKFFIIYQLCVEIDIF